MKLLPDHVQCTATWADGSPASEMMLVLLVDMSVKNSYRFAFGPTDQAGMFEVTREVMLAKSDKYIRDFPMDYVPIEAGFAGTIRIGVALEADLKAALEAYEMFRHDLCYPDGYEQHLRRAKSLLSCSHSPPRVLFKTTGGASKVVALREDRESGNSGDGYRNRTPSDRPIDG